MKRLDYEAPMMEEIVVEMEQGFLGGSVVQGTSSKVETTGHELNVIDGSTFDDNNDDNDTNGWI